MPDSTKLVAFLAVVAYALGVATTSFYLQHNDIPDPDLSLFKGHYVYTGLAVLAFILIASGIAALSKDISSPGGAVALFLVLGLVLWGLVLVALQGLEKNTPIIDDLLPALKLAALALVCGGTAI